MSRSVSSREVRLQEKDDLDWCESSVQLCPVKCREVTVKKKRVETFRYLDPYRQRAPALAQKRTATCASVEHQVFDPRATLRKVFLTACVLLGTVSAQSAESSGKLDMQIRDIRVVVVGEA